MTWVCFVQFGVKLFVSMVAVSMNWGECSRMLSIRRLAAIGEWPGRFRGPLRKSPDALCQIPLRFDFFPEYCGMLTWKIAVDIYSLKKCHPPKPASLAEKAVYSQTPWLDFDKTSPKMSILSPLHMHP